MSAAKFQVLRLRIELIVAKNYVWLITALAIACFAPGVAAQVLTGTAFAVAPGLLITNQHVIERCSSVDVIAANGRRPASIVDTDNNVDLALLRVNGFTGATARLRSPRNIRLGEPATVFGFPLAGSLSSGGNFTTGVISALRGLKDTDGVLQITAPVQAGNSGGPLMDASGLVIGVVVSKLDVFWAVIATGDIPQNVNFAISLEVLADFLAKNRVSIRNGAISAALDTARVAELVQSFTYRVECRVRSQQATVSPDELAEVRQATLQKIRETRAGAQKLLGLHEAERVRLAAQYKRQRERYDKGLISRDEALKAENALREAIIRVDEDKRWLAEADMAIEEYSLRDELLRRR